MALFGAYILVTSNFMRPTLTLTFLLFCSLIFAQANSGMTTLNKAQHSVDTIAKTEKIEIINKSFDNLVAKLTENKEDKNSIWDIIIPLLIGAGLTLGMQLVIEFWKTKKEKENKKQELISRGRAKTYFIVQVLKDLAMYKAHKQYYIRAFQIDNDEDNYKKHYDKGQQQRETEAKLDENIADYFQLITEYAILTKNIDHFKQHFEDIFHFNHPKSSKYSDINNLTDLVAGLEVEEARLKTEYKKLTAILETIQTEMK